MTSTSYNHDATAKIAQLLKDHTEIPEPYVRILGDRLDDCRNRDKFLALLTGMLEDYDLVAEDKTALGALGEEAMFFTNGNMEIAIEIVYVSPIVNEWDAYPEDYVRRIVEDAWENCGASKYSDPETWESTSEDEDESRGRNSHRE